MLNNRLIRIILIILMMFWIFFIPSIIYFVLVLSKRGAKGLRLIFWILTLIPGLGLIGAIGLLFIELFGN